MEIKNHAPLKHLLPFSVATVIACFCSLLAISQPGLLDTSFGNNGKVVYDFATLSDNAKDVIVQPDGKILVAGSCNINFVNKFGILRLNDDGSVDTSFGVNGRVETEFEGSNLTFGECMALQPDGKIVVAGSVFIDNFYNLAVARYTSDGQLDNTFSNDGMLTFTSDGSAVARAISIQSNGSILLGGSIGEPGFGGHFTVFKLTADGSLDTSFGAGTGYKTVQSGEQSGALALAIQSDGKILATGLSNDGIYSDAMVVRLTAIGNLDTTFDSDGIRILALDPFEDYATQILQLSGGKILIGGTKNIDFALIRLNSNGSYDSTFGANGVVLADMDESFDELYDLAINEDNQIIAVGHSGFNLYDMAVLRFDANGNPDDLFSLDGKTNIDFSGTYDYAHAVAIQDDGKIVVAGSTDSNGQNDFAIIRLQGICPAIGITQDISITEGQSFTVGNNTYTEAGTYEDLFLAVSGCDSLVVTTIEILTSVDVLNKENFQLYPMPFQNTLTIEGCEKDGKIVITDLIGKTMLQFTIVNEYTKLDLSRLPVGTYLFSYEYRENKKSTPIIKTN